MRVIFILQGYFRRPPEKTLKNKHTKYANQPAPYRLLSGPLGLKCWESVLRVLFRKRELTEFLGKLGELCEELGEFAFAHTHTHHRLRGTHWAPSLELGEAQKTSLTLSFLLLVFLNSLFFSPARDSLFFKRFAFFSRDFRGSVGIKVLAF